MPAPKNWLSPKPERDGTARDDMGARPEKALPACGKAFSPIRKSPSRMPGEALWADDTADRVFLQPKPAVRIWYGFLGINTDIVPGPAALVTAANLGAIVVFWPTTPHVAPHGLLTTPSQCRTFASSVRENPWHGYGSEALQRPGGTMGLSIHKAAMPATPPHHEKHKRGGRGTVTW